MRNIQAFHNDPKFKAQLLDMARQHREADDYIAGTYHDEDAERFSGCSVGCTVRDVNVLTGGSGSYDDHGFLAEQLGVPEFIARLQDRIFEGLPADQRSGWTERLLAAIPVGADLNPVLPRFLLSVQRRNLGLLDQKYFPQIYDAILGVIDLLQGWADTGRVDESAAWSAAWAVRVAARVAARSDAELLAVRAAAESAWSAAESAARAAWSAWAGAESAAWAAEWAARAESAAWAVEWAAEYSKMADDLVQLIQGAK